MKFIRYRDRTKQHRWHLVASNGRILADGGEGYRRRADRDRALERIRQGAAAAKVVDR